MGILDSLRAKLKPKKEEAKVAAIDTNKPPTTVVAANNVAATDNGNTATTAGATSPTATQPPVQMVAVFDAASGSFKYVPIQAAVLTNNPPAAATPTTTAAASSNIEQQQPQQVYAVNENQPTTTEPSYYDHAAAATNTQPKFNQPAAAQASTAEAALTPAPTATASATIQPTVTQIQAINNTVTPTIVDPAPTSNSVEPIAALPSNSATHANIPSAQSTAVEPLSQSTVSTQPVIDVEKSQLALLKPLEPLQPLQPLQQVQPFSSLAFVKPMPDTHLAATDSSSIATTAPTGQIIAQATSSEQPLAQTPAHTITSSTVIGGNQPPPANPTLSIAESSNFQAIQRSETATVATTAPASSSAQQLLQRAESHPVPTFSPTMEQFSAHNRTNIVQADVASAKKGPQLVGPNVPTLSAAEIAELRLKFNEFDLNNDGTMDLFEVTRFLSELEFTYHDDYVLYIVDSIFGLNISTQNKRVEGKLQFEEFLEFMRIFYSLHDTVVRVIEEQFQRQFNSEVSDDLIALLCQYITFNQSTGQLDWKLMNQKLAEAIEFEKQERLHNQQASKSQNSAENYINQDYKVNLDNNYSDELTLNLFNHSAAAIRADDAEQLAEVRRRREQEQQLNELRLQRQLEAAKLAAVQRELSNSAGISPESQQIAPAQLSVEANSPSDAGEQLNSTLDLSSAARLALSFDASDEEYLRQSWDLLLRYFDRNKRGGIELNDMGAALRTMGLDPSVEKLKELFARIDLDSSGVVEYREFKQYYSDLYNDFIGKGLDLGLIKRVFTDFDEDGDGQVTLDEFKHCISLLSANDLNSTEIEQLSLLTDANHDNQVDFKEFLDLIKFASLDSSKAQQFYNNHDAASRHNRIIAHKAGRSLIKKIVRATIPSPLEHILAFSGLPSNYRRSMLEIYAKREEFSTASIIQPQLDYSGLVYDEFAIDPVKKCLKPLNNFTFTQENIQVSTIGASNIEVSVNPALANTISAANLRFSQPARYLNYIITLDSCKGIPVPKELDQQLQIVARRARITLLNGSTPLSNIYTIKADWRSELEDEWQFNLRQKENEWNKLAVKTASDDCCLLIELTCLVKKTKISTASTANQASSPTATLSSYPTEADYIEMSCGFVTFDLELHHPIVKPSKIQRPVYGGTMHSKSAIKDSEILARRSGWRAFAQIFQGKVTPTMNFTITPEKSIRPQSLLTNLTYLPTNLIVATANVETLKLMYEVYAEILLLAPQPIKCGKLIQPEIQLFLRIANEPDVWQAFSELWNETKEKLPSKIKKENENNMHTTELLTEFRATIMKFWAILSMNSSQFPELVIGITDIKRLAVLRLASRVDIFTALTRDGINQSTSVGGASNSLDTANLTELAYRAIYEPFHTDEVAFDPSEASEQHHADRRAELQIQVKLNAN
jgi:Ca2+-binding EF-hand superfamily protein